jgi:hypothetical protein
MSDGTDNGAEGVAKKKKGRGPTVARWQLGALDGNLGLMILEPKYTSPEAALQAVQKEGILTARYLVREIVTETRVTARMV